MLQFRHTMTLSSDKEQSDDQERAVGLLRHCTTLFLKTISNRILSDNVQKRTDTVYHCRSARCLEGNWTLNLIYGTAAEKGGSWEKETRGAVLRVKRGPAGALWIRDALASPPANGIVKWIANWILAALILVETRPLRAAVPLLSARRRWSLRSSQNGIRRVLCF